MKTEKEVTGQIRIRRQEALGRKAPHHQLLSEQQEARLLRSWRQGDVTKAELARQFGVHASVVARVILKAGAK